MISTPMDVLKLHPVRKSKKEKESFRIDICQYAKELGYDATCERGRYGAVNVVIGDPSKAQYLVTAHYDTCARMPIPNFITPCNACTFILYQLLSVLVMFTPAAIIGAILFGCTQNKELSFSFSYLCMWLSILSVRFGPANKHNVNDNTSGVVTLLEIAKTFPQVCRHKVCFVLFDLEEAGLIGSASYQRKHKLETADQIVLNLDCVGDGSELLLIPSKKIREDQHLMDGLRAIVGTHGDRTICVHEKGFCTYPSDQKNFPLGVGIAAMHKTKRNLLYLGRIHTHRDTVMALTNVNLLRACLISLICNHAVNKKGNEYETV